MEAGFPIQFKTNTETRRVCGGLYLLCAELVADGNNLRLELLHAGTIVRVAAGLRLPRPVFLW
jgi:hypothetical protein